MNTALVLRLAALCVIGAVLALFLRDTRPEMEILLTLGVCAAALMAAAPAAPGNAGASELPLGEQAQSSSVVAVAGPYGQSVMLRDPRLDELLASHPQYSSAPNLQMPASFLRNANFASMRPAQRP